MSASIEAKRRTALRVDLAEPIQCWRIGADGHDAAWESGRLVPAGSTAQDDDPTWVWEPGDAPRAGHGRLALWTPPLLDAHTHLGDAFIRPRRHELPRDLVALVAPPDGYKHLMLAEADAESIQEAMAARAQAMRGLGTATVMDFREGGQAGLELLASATRGTIDAVGLGRPASPSTDERSWCTEVDALLSKGAYGIGLSALADLPARLTEHAAEACRKTGRRLALHLSERVHEPMETALALGARIIVHLVHCRPRELVDAADDDVLAVTCPSSNRFFKAQPPLEALFDASRDHGLRVAVGTDNAMLGDGDLLDEAAIICSMIPHASLGWLMRCMTVNPWPEAPRPPASGPFPSGLLWLSSSDKTDRAVQAPPDDMTLQQVGHLFGAGPARWRPMAAPIARE